MKLLKLIANLGYGTRREVAAMFRDGFVTRTDGTPLDTDDTARPEDIRIDGEPLDPPPGLVIMLNKPTGYTCSTKDRGALVYDLLPERFYLRKPVLATIGRLDRDTSGLLLLTDDGALSHRITSPRSKLAKTYEATLANPTGPADVATFASGTLMLESEDTPLAPAVLEVLEPKRARLTIVEGRYHQIRRMFAAVGNHVETLHRTHVGGLSLDGLPPGEWRRLDDADVARVFS